MTKIELTNILDTLAETLDLVTKHFPTTVVDQVLAILDGMQGEEGVPALKKILTNAKDVFTTKQSAELAAFLRDLENRNFILKQILKRINRA